MPEGDEAKNESRSGKRAKGMEGHRIKQYAVDKYEILTGTKRFDCDVINGKIDCDYRGNCGVIIHNRDEPFFIPEGARIAQLTIYKVADIFSNLSL